METVSPSLSYLFREVIDLVLSVNSYVELIREEKVFL